MVRFVPGADVDDIAEYDGDRIEEIGAKRFRVNACCLDTKERQFEAKQFGPARVVELRYILLASGITSCFTIK
ncbi:hypothetical protein A8O28_15300 [Enterobacteriaceae bacterium CCUG 67584]|nr:hypothetical protein [Enterobacteriaceae bacterium CCUG 67584]